MTPGGASAPPNCTADWSPRTALLTPPPCAVAHLQTLPTSLCRVCPAHSDHLFTRPGDRLQRPGPTGRADISSGITASVRQRPAPRQVQGRRPRRRDVPGRRPAARVWDASGGSGGLRRVPPHRTPPSPGPRAPAPWRSGVSQLTFAEREAGTGSPLCDLEELTPPSSALGASVRLRFDVVCEHQVAAVTWLLPERNRALGINSLNMRITSSP